MPRNFNFGPTVGERIIEQAARDYRNARRLRAIVVVALLLFIAAAIRYLAT